MWERQLFSWKSDVKILKRGRDKMLVTIKYVFLIVDVITSTGRHSEQFVRGANGWWQLRSALEHNTKIEIKELVTTRVDAGDLNGSDKEKLKSIIKFYPSFVLISHDAYHGKGLTPIEGQIYGYHDGFMDNVVNFETDKIIKWVNETIRTMPLSFAPLNQTERSLVTQWLCLIQMPCSKLGGNCIKNYIPRCLFLSCLFPLIYDGMIWTTG